MRYVNVDVTRVAELRSLVDAARRSPTGARVMDQLADRATSVEIVPREEWGRRGISPGVLGRYDQASNELSIPSDIASGAWPLLASYAPGALPVEAAASVLVHEAVHRLQSGPFPTMSHKVLAVTLGPWAQVGAMVLGAARSGADESAWEGANLALRRYNLRDELAAFAAGSRMEAELAGAAPGGAFHWERDVAPADIVSRVMDDPYYHGQDARIRESAALPLTAHAALGVAGGAWAIYDGL